MLPCPEPPSPLSLIDHFVEAGSSGEHYWPFTPRRLGYSTKRRPSLSAGAAAPRSRSRSQESFSFSTKDRAPYLVTLEVLECRQKQQRPLFSPGAGDNGGGDRGSPGGGGGAGDGGGGASGSQPGLKGGGVRFMRMLTPRALGQSLREMRSEIDRTLTTLKRTVSTTSRDGDGGAAGAGERRWGGGGGRRRRLYSLSSNLGGGLIIVSCMAVVRRVIDPRISAFNAGTEHVKFHRQGSRRVHQARSAVVKCSPIRTGGIRWGWG